MSTGYAAKYTMEWCLLADWKDALRGGEYKQITNALHTNGGHCCLGVEAMLAGHYNYYPALLTFGEMHVQLEIKLMRLNDGHRYSFVEIADWLDENVRGVLEREQYAL